MEPLARVLTILTLSVTAMHAVYSLTIAGLWLYVAERIVWWAGSGAGMIGVLAVGSWWVVRVAHPPNAVHQGEEAAPAHPVVAGRIGPRASPLTQAEGLSRSEGSRRAA